nr:hypothetical protein [Proteus mirabilis]
TRAITSADDPVTQVLGPDRPTRVRGLGYRVNTNQAYSSTSDSSRRRRTLREIEAENVSLHNKLEEVTQQMLQFKEVPEELLKFKSNIPRMFEEMMKKYQNNDNFQHTAPPELQPLQGFFRKL